jgi:hypothetical protein
MTYSHFHFFRSSWQAGCPRSFVSDTITSCVLLSLRDNYWSLGLVIVLLREHYHSQGLVLPPIRDNYYSSGLVLLSLTRWQLPFTESYPALSQGIISTLWLCPPLTQGGPRPPPNQGQLLLIGTCTSLTHSVTTAIHWVLSCSHSISTRWLCPPLTQGQLLLTGPYPPLIHGQFPHTKPCPPLTWDNYNSMALDLLSLRALSSTLSWTTTTH